jgi:hypothetical protein
MIRMTHMTRLLLVLAAAAFLLLPGAAGAAVCTPLNCAASQFSVGQGDLLAYRHSALGPVSVTSLATGKVIHRVPGGFSGGTLLVHQKAGTTLQWFDLRTGAVRGATTLPWKVRLAGVSQDGTRAVGFRLVPDGATTLVVASRSALRTFVLPGRQWDFDALRGDNLFLVRYLSTGGYQVRYLDLHTGKLAPRPLKDPHESGTIWGIPFSRLASGDGNVLFTLYVASNGAAMVHQLDLVHATARCIDLPGTGDFLSASTWALALSRDEKTLWAISPGYGRAVSLDVATRRVASAFQFELPNWDRSTGTRIALRRDGSELAVANGAEVARVALTEQKVVVRASRASTAVGWSPTGELLALR